MSPIADIGWRDLAGRVAIVGFYAWQAVRLIEQWLATGRISGVLFLSAGVLVIYFTVFRRPASRVDRSSVARGLALAGTFAPSGFRPSETQLLPDHVTAAILIIGFAFALLAIASLGRNFGIVAAHRGVTLTGPYALIRHPLYASYLVMHVGIVCANVSLWNILVWMVAETAQIGRIMREERLLTHEPAYAKYVQRVRWRLVPGLF